MGSESHFLIKYGVGSMTHNKQISLTVLGISWFDSSLCASKEIMEEDFHSAVTVIFLSV